MNADDKIREILRMEADDVEPSPAGWDAIQAGIATRRSRAWWTLGAALAGTAALVVGAVVYVATDDSTKGIEGRPITSEPPIAESPTASPSPSAVAQPNEPIDAIWPLTTTDEVARWEADRTTYPSLATASNSVMAFARNYLDVSAPEVVALEGSFGENRFQIKREGVVVSTVTVRGFGADGTAPFVVTRAESREMQISSPAAGSAVSGSITATGPYEAVDPAFDVTLYADTGSTEPVVLAAARATTGPDGLEWTAPLAFSTKAKTGSLRVTNASLRDGGISSAAAIPLLFGEATAAGPKVMVAARDGRIAVISTANGEIVRWLTAAEPGGGASMPQLSDDGKTVVYSQGSGTCSSEIRSVPVSGGTPKTLATEKDAVVDWPSLRGDVLAYVKRYCEGTYGDNVEVVVKGTTTIVEKVVGNVHGGVVVGVRFAVYVAHEDDGVSKVHSIDVHGELADSPVTAPEGCQWAAVTLGARDDNGREQMFAAADCSPRDEVVETRLYRYDADGKNRALLSTIPHLYAVLSLDYAGDFLVIGRMAREEQVAYTYIDGTLRRIPGDAQRPSWS